jgi:hypothetical protein
MAVAETIRIEGIQSTIGEILLTDIQKIRLTFAQCLEQSDQLVVENLIEETHVLLAPALASATTYQQQCESFNQITQAWLKVWQHYRNEPRAIELIRSLHHFTNYSMAYTELCHSLSLINEGKTGEELTDSERTVQGFRCLAQVIDVFVELFSQSELKRICDGAKTAMALSSRNIEEYFETDLEYSLLITDLRAYASAILLCIERHLNSDSTTHASRQKQLPKGITARLVGIAKTNRPAPTDEEVKVMLNERLVEKYL